MPRVFHIPFLIAGLLILTSCTSAEEKAQEIRAMECEQLSKERADWESQSSEFEKEASMPGSSGHYYEKRLRAWQTYRQSMVIVVDNPDCFPTYVAQAKEFIEKNEGEAIKQAYYEVTGGLTIN